MTVSLLGVIIGAAITVATTLVGNWFMNKRAREDRADARADAIAGVRRDAYAALLAKADAELIAFDDRYNRNGPTLIANPIRPDIDREVVLIRLLGPSDVGEAAAVCAKAIRTSTRDYREAEKRFIRLAQRHAFPISNANDHGYSIDHTEPLSPNSDS